MSLDGRPQDPAPLADAEARTVITGDLDRTLFVEAGAGSGKTSSLVDRIVALVVSGVRIDNIAAITFTEAAASELRHRVRDALVEMASAEGASAHLVDASVAVETAPITTLHGFALRILMQYPVEAGLPPGFEVVDEINSILDFDDAWRVFVGRIGDDLDLLELQSRASVLRLDLKHFPDVARRFDDNWDLIETADLTPPPLSDIDFGPLLERLEDVCGLAARCDDHTDKLATALFDLGEQVRSLRQLSPLDQTERLGKLSWPRTNAGRKGLWSEPSVEEVRDRVATVRADVDLALERLGDEVLKHFMSLVGDFVAERVSDRQQRGQLSFHDLLVLARRLLRSSEQVRFQLHQQYSRILLDEFQDTDPIQIELAVLLASSEPVGTSSWIELAPHLPPGRLVVVGDPKQSIYRFRRADIGVYAESESGLVDEPVRLTTNFRSVPGIVAFVNHVFGQMMGEGVPGEQPSYTPLHANRAPAPDETGPPVVVLGGPTDGTAAEIRHAEATDIAGYICTAIAEGQMVHRSDQWLPARLQDFAILIPSRLSLPALEAALGNAGLPFRPETSSLVYATQEVRDVLAGIRAVVDPASSVDVVAALRSALFAVDDTQLLRWAQAGGSWDYRDKHPSGLLESRIARAFSVLRQWHEERWWAAPASFVERIVRERRLREQSLASARPRDRWRRYRFLAEQARQFSALQGGDLHDFVRWAEIQSSDLARITEPIPAEPDDDAIRILTVHGSKGLEFPITVLAGASTQESARNTGPSVIFSDGQPNVKLGKDRATSGFDVHASVEETLDGYERARLQYVAATRARDVLVVSAHHRDNKRSTMGRRVHEHLEARTDLWSRFESVGDEVYDAQPPTQLRLVAGDHGDELDEWEAEQRRLLDLNARALVESATSISRRRAASGEDLVGDEPDAEKRPWRRGRAGTAVGSAVHAVLQHIDLTTGEGLAGLSRLHAEREGIGHLATQVESLAESALGAPTVRQAVGGRSWRELHVAIPTGSVGGLLEGYIDLLVELEEGLVVADFKTDPVSSAADADRLVADYRLQGASYAVAVEQIARRPVVECRFLFLSADGVLERSVTDLRRAMTEVEALLP